MQRRLPLARQLTSRVGSNLTGTIAAQKDQYVLDAVPLLTTNETTGAAEIVLEGRGVEAIPAFSAGTGVVYSVLQWSGLTDGAVAYARGDNHVYVRSGPAASTDLGAITGNGIFISETLIGGVATITVTSDAGSGRTWFFTVGGSLTEITDTDFPPKQTPAVAITGNFVHLGGRAHVMTSAQGQIWSSDFNSLSGWTAATYATADKYPDSGIGCMKYGSYIMAAGSKSIEFFKNSDNASGSQLTSIDGSQILIGVKNQFSMCYFNETVAFIADNQSGRDGVYLITGIGTQPKKISTPAIDLAVSYAGAFDRLSQVMSLGQTLLLLHSTTETERCFVYDPTTKLWLMWNITDNRIRSACVVRSGTVFATTTDVYEMADGDASQKNWVVQTNRLDEGTKKRKFVTDFGIICDKISSGTFTVEKSDDDYGSWQTLGSINQALMNPRIFRCGSYVGGRAYRITGTSSGASGDRATFAEYEVDIGSI